MISAPGSIGLFGGTFDPVHNGHISIVNSYLNSGYLNKLYVILTPEPPHKKSLELTAFRHRMEMLKLVFGGEENPEISDIENRLPKPSYTLNTVGFFSRKFPDSELYLCIGEDSLVDFTSWYRWESILSTCTLLVTQRPDAASKKIPGKLENHIRYVDHRPVDISSSEIRESIRLGENVNNMVPDNVLHYIKKHHLYHD